MSDLLGQEFRSAAERHDEILRTADEQVAAGGARARRLRADGLRVSEELIGDIGHWTGRLRFHRQRLAELRDQLDAERVAVHRVARRVLWGWSAIWLRVNIVALWIRLHIVAILIVAMLMGVGTLVAVYWDVIVAAYRALTGAFGSGIAAGGKAKP